MSNTDFEFQSRPVRKTDKRKHHKRGFSEDVQDKRQARIQFKQYIRELEEEEFLDNLDDVEDVGE